MPVPVPALACVCLIKDSRVWKGIFGIWDSAEIQCGIGKDARIVNGKRYLPVTRGAGCATSNVMRLFQLVQFVKCWQIFLELNSKKTVSKFRKRKKKVVVLCSRPGQNVKLGSFTLQSCSDGKEMFKRA